MYKAKRPARRKEQAGRVSTMRISGAGLGREDFQRTDSGRIAAFDAKLVKNVGICFLMVFLAVPSRMATSPLL